MSFKVARLAIVPECLYSYKIRVPFTVCFTAANNLHILQTFTQ